MPDSINTSSDGLAACPSCGNHVRVDRDHLCPFCDYDLSPHLCTGWCAGSLGDSAQWLLRATKSGLMVGALVGVATIGASCGPVGPSPQPLYGAPAVDVGNPDSGSDTGESPDMGGEGEEGDAGAPDMG
jgi:hypothetical protein